MDILVLENYLLFKEEQKDDFKDEDWRQRYELD